MSEDNIKKSREPIKEETKKQISSISRETAITHVKGFLKSLEDSNLPIETKKFIEGKIQAYEEIYSLNLDKIKNEVKEK